VDEADTVTVSFQDGRILAGKVLGKDPVTDVAVIQVQAENNLPTVVIGDSDQVRQGQWANASGQVQHPYIGIQMVALNPQVRQQINNAPNSKIQVENDQGLLVVSVGRGTPAAKAGLQAGDVIEAINSEPVTKANLVQRLVDKAGVGGNLQMDVRRNRQTVALTVEPEQLPNIQSR
jgi:S1-C subfamily serine protease